MSEARSAIPLADAGPNASIGSLGLGERGCPFLFRIIRRGRVLMNKLGDLIDSAAVGDVDFLPPEFLAVRVQRIGDDTARLRQRPFTLLQECRIGRFKGDLAGADHNRHERVNVFVAS